MKRRHIPGNWHFQLGFEEDRRGLRRVRLWLQSWIEDEDGTILLTRGCETPPEWETALRDLRVELQTIEKAGQKILSGGVGRNQYTLPRKLTPTEKLKQEIMRLELLVHQLEAHQDWAPRDFLGTP